MQAEPIEISVLGRTLRARNANRHLAAWLMQNWWFPEVTAPPHHFTIDIELLPARPRTLAAAPRLLELARLDGITLQWLRHGERWWSSGTVECGVEFQIRDVGASVRIWGGEQFVPHSDVALALHVALCEALRASGLAPLHAGVIVRDGRATALLGASGAGKTSTLMLALGAGWLPLTEDFAWLDLAARSVYGWDRGLRLSAAAIRRAGAPWGEYAWRAQADGKFFLEYERLEVMRVWEAQLERMVLLERDASRASRFEPLPPREAVRALWEAAGLPLCTRNRDAFARHAAQLIHDVEQTRLVLGQAPAVVAG